MPLLPLALHLLYLAGDPWAMVGSGRSNLVCRPPLHSNKHVRFIQQEPPYGPTHGEENGA